MRKLTIFLCLVALFFQGCDRLKKKKPLVIRDTTITETTSFNTLFFDSSVINTFLNRYPEFASYKQQFIDFYTQRNFELAWFDSAGLSEQAHNFYNLQSNYIGNIGDSTIYNNILEKLYDSLNLKTFTPSSKDLVIANTELLLTGQFFKYASKVYGGSDIDAAELGWFIPRKKIDVTALLDTMINKKVATPEQYVPLNDQYKKLEALVPIYVDKQKQESTDTILFVSKPLRSGDSADIIVQIKRRLYLLQPDIPLDSSGNFDTSLVKATKRFQRSMGLYVDGAIGNRMIAELNVPLEKRIQQLLVNMERMRWMPPENDSNYIVVNIPEYKMHVYDSGRLAFDMNVIVGSAINSTVIFNGNLKYVVFSPYWNVPESIVKKEIMPAMAKDKNYIAKNEMEITGYSGKIPIVRQKPGNKNSLGLVKFLFPNNYNIYFHDTPNRNLFSQSSRSLSHGCIRLGEPKKFAQYLLREDSAIWNSNKIDSAMHLAKEKWVGLKKTIPVFLVYFTAWVDKNGVLNFRKDIYGHDEKMAAKLFSK
ncbi:MAG: L,D-transpeptidase family protein [Sediminibacterium sp.]|nr:L,D-transpeptidase family protein [Sediminibacterium sp.]